MYLMSLRTSLESLKGYLIRNSLDVSVIEHVLEFPENSLEQTLRTSQYLIQTIKEHDAISSISFVFDTGVLKCLIQKMRHLEATLGTRSLEVLRECLVALTLLLNISPPLEYDPYKNPTERRMARQAIDQKSAPYRFRMLETYKFGEIAWNRMYAASLPVDVHLKFREVILGLIRSQPEPTLKIMLKPGGFVAEHIVQAPDFYKGRYSGVNDPVFITQSLMTKTILSMEILNEICAPRFYDPEVINILQTIATNMIASIQHNKKILLDETREKKQKPGVYPAEVIKKTLQCFGIMLLTQSDELLLYIRKKLKFWDHFLYLLDNKYHDMTSKRVALSFLADMIPVIDDSTLKKFDPVKLKVTVMDCLMYRIALSTKPVDIDDTSSLLRVYRWLMSLTPKKKRQIAELKKVDVPSLVIKVQKTLKNPTVCTMHDMSVRSIPLGLQASEKSIGELVHFVKFLMKYCNGAQEEEIIQLMVEFHKKTSFTQRMSIREFFIEEVHGNRSKYLEIYRSGKFHDLLLLSIIETNDILRSYTTSTTDFMINGIENQIDMIHCFVDDYRSVPSLSTFSDIVNPLIDAHVLEQLLDNYVKVDTKTTKAISIFMSDLMSMDIPITEELCDILSEFFDSNPLVALKVSLKLIDSLGESLRGSLKNMPIRNKSVESTSRVVFSVNSVISHHQLLHKIASNTAKEPNLTIKCLHGIMTTSKIALSSQPLILGLLINAYKKLDIVTVLASYKDPELKYMVSDILNLL